MFRIVPIVEGHGEVEAVPILIRRILHEAAPHFQFTVEKSIRQPRSRLLKDENLYKAVDFAASKIMGWNGAIIIVLDADDDCPRFLGTDILQRTKTYRTDRYIKVILPKSEFEAWFIAAATSLAGRRGFSASMVPPSNPEDIRGAKEWLRQHAISYSETVDQPALAAQFDMAEAERNSPSFAKFLRDVRSLASCGA